MLLVISMVMKMLERLQKRNHRKLRAEKSNQEKRCLTMCQIERL